MKKYLVRTLAIASLASALLVGNFAFAQNNKATMQSQNNESSAKDPDLKLSIEELKKKYPIGWLGKKYGNQLLCNDVDEDNIENMKRYAKLVNKEDFTCSFTLEKDRTNLSKDSNEFDEKIEIRTKYVKSIDYFSESQIKSIFLHVDKNFIKFSKEDGELYVEAHDSRELSIIYLVCRFFDETPNQELSSKQKKLKSFLFSKKISSYINPFAPSEIQKILQNIK